MIGFSRSPGKVAPVLLLTLVMLGGCSSPNLSPTPQPTPITPVTRAGSATPSTPEVELSSEPCQSGKLLVRDLPAMDVTWRAGLAEAKDKAFAWQQDSVLSSMSVACQLFESEFRWQATFYSLNAQAFFSSDTGEVVPSGYENQVPELDVEELSFALLHQALTAAGYEDDTVISPSSGVDIRLNSVTAPFGPPSAPKDVILYHVTIERLGEVRDLFVDARNGTVYLYQN